MMLGDALNQTGLACSLLDDELIAEIEARGMAPERFARMAVLDFERRASPEDWATLMSMLRAAADPAAACLDAMVRWRLAAGLQAGPGAR
jgi:hypothetical protein